MNTFDDAIDEGHEVQAMLHDVARGAPAADMTARVHSAMRNRRRTQYAARGAGLALVGLAVTSAAIPALHGPSDGRAVMTTAPEDEAPRAAPATWAQVSAAIVWEDATATAERLTTLGFELHWTGFVRAGDGTQSPSAPVDAAPAGAQVWGVLDSAGKPNGPDRPASNKLFVEAVTLAKDAQALGDLAQVFPDASAVIDRNNPQKTAKALEELDYQVVWHLITPNPSYDPVLAAESMDPGRTFSNKELDRMQQFNDTSVKTPPPGTKIITSGTADINGTFTAFDRDSRTIGFEIR